MNYNLLEFLDSFEDPRRAQGLRHKQRNVLFIIMMAILSKENGIRGFARFAKANEESLIKELELKHGVPVYSTFHDILSQLNDQLFAKEFAKWMRQFHPDLGDNFIGVDGKAVKSSVAGGNTSLQSFVSVVSAFGHSSGMVYGMKSFDNGKSGEGQSARDVITDIGVIDKTFTMDALHCDKKTLDLILAFSCHFLIQTKRNCGKLWETIALYTALASPISTFEYYESGHGREVYRRVELFDADVELPKGWNGIKQFVRVRRWGFRNGKRFEEVAYYIYSRRVNSAQFVARGIQNHWFIENKLHWVKDVNMSEDDMTMGDTNKISLLAYLNNIAINLLKAAGLKPTRETFSKYSNKVEKLINLFENAA